MENIVHEFKYQKHSEKQHAYILSVAESLFIERGIEQVNLVDISKECGIMRSTFYRYFKNKDEILWHIMHKNTGNFSSKISEKFQQTGGTTYDRFKIVLDTILEVFKTNPSTFLFIDLFNNKYQFATSSNDNDTYNKVYKTDDFRSGDTVKFLTESFHDGSVKAELDPKKTAVTVIYCSISIVIGLTKQLRTMEDKYGIHPEDVVKSSFDALLASIR